MTRIAFGRLKLSQSEFWLMSLREFWLCLEEWNEEQELRTKQGWEQARYIAKAIVSIQVQKKDRSKLDKAFSLPWDNDGKKTAKAEKLTPEEIEKQEAETIRIAKKLEKILV